MRELGELVGQRAEVVVDSGREHAEQREELEANAHAEETGVAVRGVRGERNRVTGDVGVNGGAGSPNEGANEVTCARGEDREAAGAGAAEEAQEHGLGPIVAVVRGRDERRAGRGGPGAQGLVTEDARPLLEVPTVRQFYARSSERDVQGAREVGGKVELLRRFRPEAMVDPLGDEGVADPFAEKREDVQERHRVGATADRDEDALAAGEQLLLADRACGDGEQGRGVRGGHQGVRGGFPSSNSLQNVTSSPASRAPPGTRSGQPLPQVAPVQCAQSSHE